MLKQKSFVLKPSDAKKQWHLVDASGQTVGRLASELASLLRGKHRPQFTPNTDSGDYVVVVNCEQVKFSGKKWDEKNYYRHSGHIGSLKKRTAKEQLEKHPELILMNAVKGMLPKNSLGRKQLTKLKVFVGAQHTHQAQNPRPYTLRNS